MNVRTNGVRFLGLILAIALAASACGSDSDSSEDSTAAAETTEDDANESEAPEAEAADLQLSTTSAGDALVDGNGNTLYLFVPDNQGESTCYEQCEAAWPVVGELASVGSGLDAGLLGTTVRTNGDVQATYNGWPLYYYASDTAPGEANGQGANDVWFVVDASGNAING